MHHKSGVSKQSVLVSISVLLGCPTSQCVAQASMSLHSPCLQPAALQAQLAEVGSEREEGGEGRAAVNTEGVVGERQFPQRGPRLAAGGGVGLGSHGRWRGRVGEGL